MKQQGRNFLAQALPGIIRSDGLAFATELKKFVFSDLNEVDC